MYIWRIGVGITRETVELLGTLNYNEHILLFNTTLLHLRYIIRVLYAYSIYRLHCQRTADSRSAREGEGGEVVMLELGLDRTQQQQPTVQLSSQNVCETKEYSSHWNEQNMNDADWRGRT